MPKKPLVAAVLNFFLFGGGTLYVGKRKLVGALLTVGGTIAQAARSPRRLKSTRRRR